MLRVWSYLLQLLGLTTPPHHLPIGHQSPALPVPELHTPISPEDFFAQFVIPGRPVILRGAAKSFPAHQLWSDEYFLSQPESAEWTIAYELGKKETRTGGQEPIPFAEYVRHYQTEDWYLVSGLPKFLRRDLPVYPAITCDFVLHHLMDDLVMWFSSGGTKSVWHFDDYENLNCLIAGDKELTLADRTSIEQGHMMEAGSFSAVDVDAVDLDRFPGFAHIQFYNATISAGDCVYIPTFWPHAVTSWGRNIAINAWWEIYKTPISCGPEKRDTFQDVKFLTDSDLGGGGDFVDPNDSRGPVENFRAFLWGSRAMRHGGVLTREEFVEVLTGVDELLQDGTFDAGDSKLWEAVFDRIDENKDSVLQPTELDKLRTNTIFRSILTEASQERIGKENRHEL